ELAGDGFGRRFFFSSRRRHTRWPRDWSSDVRSSDLLVSAQECNWTSGISASAIACCWPGHPVPMMPNFSSSMPGGSSSPLLDIRVLRLRRHFLASPAEPPIHLTFFHDARWNEPPPVSCYISILPLCR